MNDRRRQRGGFQNKSNGASTGAPPARSGLKLETRSGLSGLLENIRNDYAGLRDSSYKSPLKATTSLLGFIGTIFGIAGFSLSNFFGTGGGSSFTWSITLPFPLRLGCFALLAASIGWTVSTIGIFLTRNVSPWALIVARFATFLAALFLATAIDWLFPGEIRSAPNFVLALAVAGSALAVYLAKTNYKLTYETNMRTTALRAELLLVFALGLTITVVVQQMIGSKP